MRSKLTRLATLVLVVGCGACKGTETFTGACSTSADCPVGAYCRSDGLCACRTDEACQDGQFCNLQGICQARTACRSNADCGEADFCDLTSGDCIARTACGSDVHCMPGSVCQRGATSCIPGCFDDGDCPLYAICEHTGSSTSALGSCIANKCSTKAYCDYGQRCTSTRCVNDANPNHCAPCENRRGDCGSERNFCLVNSSYDPTKPASGTEFFCGVECRDEGDCPNGYGCGGVILLTQDQCTTSSQCGGGGRECLVGEGELRGYCTCAADADCAFEELPPRCAGSCSGLGVVECTRDEECSGRCVFKCSSPEGVACTSDDQCQPTPLCAPGGVGGAKVCITDGITRCNTGQDCLCYNDACINTGRPCSSGADCNLKCEGGGCLLGRACAPLEGLLCPDVR